MLRSRFPMNASMQIFTPRFHRRAWTRGAGFAPALLAVLMRSGSARAGCSVCACGDPTFFINDARLLSSRQVLISVDYFNARNESAPHVHPGHSGSAAPGELESRVENDVRFTAQYGLFDRVMLTASLPYVFKQQSFNGETSSVEGIGDLDLTAVALVGRMAGERLALQATGGVRVPTGDSELQDENGSIDPHLQPGSGAWSGTGGVQATWAGSVPLFAGATYQWNQANAQGFQFGDVLRFNFGAQRTVAGSVDAIVEANGRWADYDTHDGFSDPNSGGTVVFFSPGLRWRIAPVVHLRAQVQFPVVEDLYGIQDEKAAARVALVWMP